MKFNKIVLDNGLTVLHEERDVPVTTVMLASKFGAVYESAEEKGIAHFMEHMAFKGTNKRSAFEISSEVERVGGILNAFTDEEQTAYHVKLPSNHLEKAMDIIFDIFFNPIYDDTEFKKEANVICEEIKMYNDDPRRKVLEEIKKCLYSAPFGMFIAGTKETVLGLRREDLRKKHEEFYSPENAVLSVVGRNNFKEIVALAKKFSKNLKKNNISAPKSLELKYLKIKETRKNLEQANIAIGFHVPVKMRYASDVFTSILGEGMSSKLFTEVREKRGLAYAVKAYADIGNNFGYLVIYIGTEKKNVDSVIKICIEEFRKMDKINEKELSEGKQQVIGNFEVSKEDSGNVALGLIEEEMKNSAEEYYRYAENITKVSLNDIKKLSEIKDYAYYVLES